MIYLEQIYLRLLNFVNFVKQKFVYEFVLRKLSACYFVIL